MNQKDESALVTSLLAALRYTDFQNFPKFPATQTIPVFKLSARYHFILRYIIFLIYIFYIKLNLNQPIGII